MKKFFKKLSKPKLFAQCVEWWEKANRLQDELRGVIYIRNILRYDLDRLNLENKKNNNYLQEVKEEREAWRARANDKMKKLGLCCEQINSLVSENSRLTHQVNNLQLALLAATFSVTDKNPSLKKGQFNVGA